MKRKTILMIVLVLAIVTALSAGTLAVYTTSVDLTGHVITVKRFAVTAASVEDATVQQVLAPLESNDYAFEITNLHDSMPCEESLDVTLKLDVDEALFTEMPGLEITLLSDGHALKTWTAANASASYVADTLFRAGIGDTHAFVLRTTWNDQTPNGGLVLPTAFTLHITGMEHV